MFLWAKQVHQSEKTVNFSGLSTILFRSKETKHMKFILYEKEECSCFHYLIQIFVWLYIWLLFSTTYFTHNTVIKKSYYGWCCLLFCVKFAFYSHKNMQQQKNLQMYELSFLQYTKQHPPVFFPAFFCIEIMNDIKQNHHHENEGLNY